MLYRNNAKEPIVHIREWIRIHWKDRQGEWVECVWENEMHAATILDQFVSSQGEDFVRLERSNELPAVIASSGLEEVTQKVATEPATFVDNDTLEVVESAHDTFKQPKGREPEKILQTVRDLLAMLDRSELDLIKSNDRPSLSDLAGQH